LRLPDRGRDRVSLSHVPRMQDDADAGLPVPGREDVAGAVGRAIVHDEDFFFDRDGGDLPEDLVDRPRLVVDGDQNGKLHGRRDDTGKAAADGGSLIILSMESRRLVFLLGLAVSLAAGVGMQLSTREQLQAGGRLHALTSDDDYHLRRAPFALAPTPRTT